MSTKQSQDEAYVPATTSQVSEDSPLSTEQRDAAAYLQAIRPQASERSPLLLRSYASVYPPDHPDHVIPPGVELPYAAVWHPEDKTVFYMSLDRKVGADGASGDVEADMVSEVHSDDENNEDDTENPLYYDVISHDGGVSVRATSKEGTRFESTPKSLTFTAMPSIYLKNTLTIGEREDLKSRRNTAHILYFKNKRTGSFRPGFVGDTFGKGNKKRHVTAVLGSCKKGTHPWLFREDSRIIRGRTRDAESSV
jgi:hypothetical protein